MDDFKQFDDREIGELAAIIRHYRKNGLWLGQPSSKESLSPSAGIWVKNTENATIPVYACLQIDGTVVEDSRTYVKVKKPTSTGVAYLFNGHAEIEANGYGRAYDGPLVLAYKNTGTVTAGDRWGPTSGQYYLTKDAGNWIAVGSDDLGTNVLKVMVQGGGVRLYRFTLNASWSSNVAAADILEMDGTDTGIDGDIRDPLGIFSALTTDDPGICIFQDGKYYVIQAPCPS